MSRRASGIIMHISSLPGKYGIGDFGEGAYNFVDFLHESGQKYWEILPLGVTGLGDSPYQCFSAFAGNPYFIDLDELLEGNYLNQEVINKYELYREPQRVSYDLLYQNKMKLLRIAYENSKSEMIEELEVFMETHKSWLRNFALFMSLKDYNNGKSWLEWEDSFKDINSKDVLEFENTNKESIYFWVFTQYLFLNQWENLKKHANLNGIKIIGDLPIYVSIDSSDVWANTNLFKLDSSFKPITISGVPADEFAIEGQLWGNPIYDWEAIEENEYSWWIERISHSFELFDTLRIDHFIGFQRYWEVQYKSENAVRGEWIEGPGIKIFHKIREELGDLDIIAEDLGVVTDDVRKLVKDTGFPGMKVLEFGFNPYKDNEFDIHNHNENSVVYTGTHDLSTADGWIERQSIDTARYTKEYLNIREDEDFNWAFIRGAWSSSSYLAIAQMQDFLGLDDNARMNIPGTVGGNWTWRVDRDTLNKDLSKKINALTKLYKR